MSSNVVVKTEINKVIVKNADGKDGKSAYQQAVEGGYTGTEQEFNCSLSLLADVNQGKKQIADAINYKGGEANPNEAFIGLANDIKEIPNFNTYGFEFISDVYKPTTLMEAYNNRTRLKSIVNHFLEEISGNSTFYACSSLQSVQLPNLTTISGGNTFQNCSSLNSVQLPNLTTISEGNTFYACSSLNSVQLPNLTTISESFTFLNCLSLNSVQLPNLTTISGGNTFGNCTSLQSIQFGTLVRMQESFNNAKPNLRNVTIGEGTDINLSFQQWTATNVIAEGQSGIDELNTNLYNNLLTKLADHSFDGQTRTLRLGWLAHVTQENIDYANSKGWTLTT